MREDYIDEEDEVNEEDVSKVISMMKVLKLPGKPSLNDSKTSTESDSDSEEEARQNNAFDKYLKQLQDEKAKNKHLLLKTKRTQSIIPKYEVKVQSFAPIGKNYATNLNSQRKLKLGIIPERRLENCRSEMFISEKNVIKASPLLNPNNLRNQPLKKVEIISESMEYFNTKPKILRNSDVNSEMGVHKSSSNYISSTRVQSSQRNTSSPTENFTCTNLYSAFPNSYNQVEIDEKYVMEKSEPP